MSEDENKFEDYIDVIDEEIKKRRSKWKLTSITWMDFDDISQILRIHIYKKWHLYDPVKPLAPWLNRIITNQIKNLIRNNYGNYARPCLKCAASEGGDLCVIYEKQCSDCPLYAHWEKNKKIAHDVKVPVSLENHQQDLTNMKEDANLDIDFAFQKLNKILPKHLKPIEWKIYENLYIKNLPEAEVAKLMGYKTSEKNRSPGYKQIKNIKKSIIQKIKKLIKDGEVDFL
tara:strand:- start:32 stop:718 length:687 start_codon:yes stop_codon:yes gene_type:complete